MRGLYDEKGDVKHPFAVWSSYFNECGEFKYRKTLEGNTPWLPCDAYVIFTFCKPSDPEETHWKGDICKDGPDLKPEELSYELFYEKAFVNLMLAAAEWYGKNDDMMVKMLEDKLKPEKGS